MKFSLDVIFLSIIKKPYNFDGKAGVSFPARVIFDGQTYVLKSTEELYESLRDIPQLSKGKAEIEIISSREQNTVHLRSFTATKQ